MWQFHPAETRPIGARFALSRLSLDEKIIITGLSIQRNHDNTRTKITRKQSRRNGYYGGFKEEEGPGWHGWKGPAQKEV
jgi:hypothetical protein